MDKCASETRTKNFCIKIASVVVQCPTAHLLKMKCNRLSCTRRFMVVIISIFCLCYWIFNAHPLLPLNMFKPKFVTAHERPMLQSQNSSLIGWPTLVDESEQAKWYHMPGSINVTWYRNKMMTNADSLVSVYSAYHSPPDNHVALIAVSHVARLLEKNEWPFQHFCAFYDGTNNANSSAVVVEATFFTSYLVFCPLQKFFYPTRVILYRNNSAWDPKVSKPPWTIPIRYNELAVKSGKVAGQDLAVCLKMFFGEPNWLLLLQFFEYYRLQGETQW